MSEDAFAGPRTAANADLRIPMIPITRSGGSRSVIPIDHDQCGVA
jgi:hypothetical protein